MGFCGNNSDDDIDGQIDHFIPWVCKNTVDSENVYMHGELTV